MIVQFILNIAEFQPESMRQHLRVGLGATTITITPGTKFGSKPCGLRISIRKPYIPGIDFQAQWAYRYG